jgi:hypothetical protein
MYLDTWTQVLQDSFFNLWAGIVEFLPNVLVSLAIVLVGWLVGTGLSRLIAQGISALHVDQALRNAGIEDVMQRAGYRLNAGAFLGALVKWFVIIVFVVAALDVLQLTQVTNFLQQVVLLYLPQVIVAVLILLFAAVIAEMVFNLIVGSSRAADVGEPVFLGTVAKWAIWIFAILTALNQLGVAQEFVQTLFTGIVVALALGLGLSFGLGGQHAAGQYIEHVRHRLKSKRD